MLSTDTGKKGFWTQFHLVVLQLIEKITDGREKLTAKVVKIINLRHEPTEETTHRKCDLGRSLLQYCGLRVLIW